MNLYLQSALSPSTRHTYCSGFKAYYTFCKQISQRTFPLKESILQLFVTSLAGRLKYSSIKVYLCGIQYQSIICGFQEKIAPMGKLYYVMRGIRRVHSTGRVKQRLPITPSHLRDMISFVQNSLFSNYDKAMWKCLILLAFFGLLRVSEYVCPGQRKYDPSINLMPSDVKFCGDIVYINLKASKTDPFRAGFKVRLVRIGGNLCPVTALIDYIVYRGATVGPLFILSSGEFVTRKYVSAFINISLPRALNLHTHSFRIGGASAAASCGIPDSAIKILGRWSSDCYRRYIHLSDNVMKEWCTKIAGLNGVTKLWDIKSL